MAALQRPASRRGASGHLPARSTPAGVYLLSPLLRTLTKTISEDSVIAMTVGLLIIHLYLHDYK
jgi:hypothetical protein